MSSLLKCWLGDRPKFLFYSLLLLLALAAVGCSSAGAPAVQTNPTATSFTPSGLPHVQGAQIVDASGRPFLLHGAQVESSFNFIKGWEGGKRPTDTLNSATFNAMGHDWHMNTLRLPISNWIYAKYTADYLSQLDQVIHDANAAGLYVVLDLHDNSKAGSPYGKDSTLPKTEDATFWKTIAGHYKNNPMVMYDPYNEPQIHGWDQWLHGGGTTSDGATIVGFQDLVNAIRSAGSQQIIVVEPGAAGGGKGGGGNSGNNNGNGSTTAAEEGGWSNFPLDHAIKDPNIVYSLHVYQGVTQSPDVQNKKWGPILNRYPVYYGEWAFLTNGAGKSAAAHCQSLPTNGTQASQVVNNFLSYMDSIHASWTAWQFAPHYLVQDYKTYAPTQLPANLTCGDQKANVGMGSIIRQHLTGTGS